jgi:anti-sigma factor RsiW
MMCPEMEVRLNEYVDGTLAAPERAEVEVHLAGCAGCRTALAELRAVASGARELPASIVPKRDLWAGIATRINERAEGRRWWRERTFWAGALAAAATLVLALGTYRLIARSPLGPGGGTEQSWVAVQADYDRAADELSRLLVAQRGRLQPGTIALVERNLGIIDAAIRDSRAALARDPGNVDLRTLYAAARRQRVDLLRWAARLAVGD